MNMDSYDGKQDHPHISDIYHYAHIIYKHLFMQVKKMLYLLTALFDV